MQETTALSQGGTDQLLHFSAAVYERILQIEQRVGHAGAGFRGAAGSKVFVRLDISLFWVESENRYRFCLNEVQPGMAGMFKFGDNGSVIAEEFVQGIIRGSLDA